MPERAAGICLHLTSLPGPYGIGSLGSAARQFVDRLEKMGVSVWQFLPIGPTAYGNSPYQSLSAFAGNALLIDLQDLENRGLLSAGELQPLTELAQDQIDFSNLIPLKSSLLSKAARRLLNAMDATESRQFSRFLHLHDAQWLHEYALFQVLKDQNGQRAWSEWDRAFVMRTPQVLAELARDFGREIQEVKVIQYLFFTQWQAFQTYAAKAGVRLFGDVPIYIALDSAEAWSHPELLQLNEQREATFVAGVPPDYFSEDGQRWGNPLYDWQAHSAQDFSWWRQRLNHAMSLHDMIRLDHFRGFESYWAIPAWSETAREGEWREGPADSLFNALREQDTQLTMVAEDLGIITDQVEALRQRCGFPGMKVLQFLVDDERFHPDQIPWDCVCYTGTHDNDTIDGWLSGSSTEDTSPEHLMYRRDRARALTQSDNLRTGLVQLALETQARLAVIPMQDVLGLDSSARMNTPGTTQGNWQWRMDEGQLTDELTGKVREWIEKSERVGTSHRNDGIIDGSLRKVEGSK